MPKLEVIAKAVRYAGKEYRFGQTFDASDKDAKVLKAIKKVKDAAPEVPKTQRVPERKPVVETRVMAAEAPAPTADGSDGEASRRRYRRSDMRSED